MPSCKSGRGRKAHPNVWDGSGGPPGSPAGDGRLSRKSGRGWEELPEVREELGEVRRPCRNSGNSRGTPGSPGGVGRPSWKSWRGRDALPEVWEWSGAVERPTKKTRSS